MAAVISASEAARAIYLDFEGCKSEDPPSLLGTLYVAGRRTDGDDVLAQTIVEVALRPLAGRVHIPGMSRYANESASLGGAIDIIIRLAEKQDRTIVTWSLHDPGEVTKHVADERLVARFLALHQNAIPTARRWRREVLELPTVENALRNYLPLVDFAVPIGALGGRVGHTIRRVRRALESRDDFDGLTESQQQAWVNLLWHNVSDLQGMQAVVVAASAGLAR